MFGICRSSLSRFVSQTVNNSFIIPKNVQNYSTLLTSPFLFRTPVRKLEQETSKLTDLVVSRTYRNGRIPKKPNHGKRPCCHTRRRAKKLMIKSRGYREKLFGFW